MSRTGVKTPARPHSLRARLVATVLLLLAVDAVAVIGVTTTLALRQFLYGRLDREVVEANSRFVAVQTGQFRAAGRVPLRRSRAERLPRPRPGRRARSARRSGTASCSAPR